MLISSLFFYCICHLPFVFWYLGLTSNFLYSCPLSPPQTSILFLFFPQIKSFLISPLPLLPPLFYLCFVIFSLISFIPPYLPRLLPLHPSSIPFLIFFPAIFLTHSASIAPFLRLLPSPSPSSSSLSAQHDVRPDQGTVLLGVTGIESDALECNSSRAPWKHQEKEEEEEVEEVEGGEVRTSISTFFLSSASLTFLFLGYPVSLFSLSCGGFQPAPFCFPCSIFLSPPIGPALVIERFFILAPSFLIFGWTLEFSLTWDLCLTAISQAIQAPVCLSGCSQSKQQWKREGETGRKRANTWRWGQKLTYIVTCHRTHSASTLSAEWKCFMAVFEWDRKEPYSALVPAFINTARHWSDINPPLTHSLCLSPHTLAGTHIHSLYLSPHTLLQVHTHTHIRTGTSPVQVWWWWWCPHLFSFLLTPQHHHLFFFFLAPPHWWAFVASLPPPLVLFHHLTFPSSPSLSLTVRLWMETRTDA